MNHVRIEAYIRIESVDQKKKKEFFEKKKRKKFKKINRVQRGKSGAINHFNNSRIDERCPLRGQVREKARIESIVNQIEDGIHKSGFRKRKEGREGRGGSNFIPRFISSTWFRLAFHLPATWSAGKFSASISISAYFQGNDWRLSASRPLPLTSKLSLTAIQAPAGDDPPVEIPIFALIYADSKKFLVRISF